MHALPAVFCPNTAGFVFAYGHVYVCVRVRGGCVSVLRMCVYILVSMFVVICKNALIDCCLLTTLFQKLQEL